MKNGYLIAAYVITWVIHGGYIATVVAKYSRLQREKAELRRK